MHSSFIATDKHGATPLKHYKTVDAPVLFLFLTNPCVLLPHKPLLPIIVWRVGGGGVGLWGVVCLLCFQGKQTTSPFNTSQSTVPPSQWHNLVIDFDLPSYIFRIIPLYIHTHTHTGRWCMRVCVCVYL